MGNYVCSQCRGPAVFRMRHHRLAFCQPHYLEWFIEQTARVIEKYHMFAPTDRILVALSLQVTPEDFFEVYGETFRRNSRWSTARNVPQLGDWSTPYEEVESFYEFWCVWRHLQKSALHCRGMAEEVSRVFLVVAETTIAAA